MKRPIFIAIAAVTIDGKIARHKHHFSGWTSREDKNFLHKMLDSCDCVIVGNNTYKAAKKPLSRRNCIVLTSKVKSFSRISKKLLYCNPTKTDMRMLIIKNDYRRIAILGGAQTYYYCLKHNMLDELYLTIEPIVFGKGIGLFLESSSLGTKFKLMSSKKLNKKGTILLIYKKI